MVGPSKILTVSYGTFSCTLEGFDNPFSTMRGIAEYFRDLAADDRYFGAEPPIPDAEMLHRIAEAGADKPVVAHVEENGVTLRQIDSDDRAAPAAEIVVPAETAVNDPFIDEPADIVALNEPSEVQAESVAAKLARIRAVVSNDNVATIAEDVPADRAFTSSPISAAFEDTQTDWSEDDLSPAAEPVAEPEPDIAADDVQAEADAPDEVPGDSVEASLEDSALVATEPGAEPEAEPEADTLQTSEPQVHADTEDQAEPTDTPDTSATPDPADTETVAQFMGASETSDQADDGGEIDGEDIDDEDIDDDGAQDDPDSVTLSRVIRMRRSDFVQNQDSAPAGGQSESDDSENQNHMPGSQAPDGAVDSNVSSLSPEDEAELMANLAEVQRKADAEHRSEKQGRALLENENIESSPESVSRILAVTNTELEETEGARRRSAIAHLKAAVAATRADKFLTSQREQEEAEELDQYRDDLAKVVTPRRPSGSEISARQAPLMLVSEQRVDEPDQPVEPVGSAIMPRRIAADEQLLSDADRENIFLENNTFAEFAAEMGASELPDLLEAAAAYSAYVQGHAHFSRPQIMQAVAGIREQAFSREEGLRSFGLLLRRGKIKKIKRGQFAIADTTRFNPQPRAVGE